MKHKIEAEGNEIVLSSGGNTAIIPKDKREEVLGYLNDGNHKAITKLVSRLPKYENYAEDGTMIPNAEPVYNSDNEPNYTKGSLTNAMKNSARLKVKSFKWYGRQFDATTGDRIDNLGDNAPRVTTESIEATRDRMAKEDAEAQVSNPVKKKEVKQNIKINAKASAKAVGIPDIFDGVIANAKAKDVTFEGAKAAASGTVNKFKDAKANADGRPIRKPIVEVPDEVTNNTTSTNTADTLFRQSLAVAKNNSIIDKDEKPIDVIKELDKANGNKLFKGGLSKEEQTKYIMESLNKMTTFDEVEKPTVERSIMEQLTTILTQPNTPAGIEASNKLTEVGVKTVDEYYDLAVAYAKRKYNKLVEHEEPISPYKARVVNPNADETLPRVTGLHESGKLNLLYGDSMTYSAGVMDLNNTKFNTRGRGETPKGIKQVGPRSFKPFTRAGDYNDFKRTDNGKSVNDPNSTYIGVSSDGTFKTGNLDDFDADDKIARTFGNWFSDFIRDENGKIVLEDDKIHSGGNPGNLVPTFKGVKDDGTPIGTNSKGGVGGSLNMLTGKTLTSSAYYGSVYGGAVIVKDSAGRMAMISGSLDNIDNEVTAFKNASGDETIKIITVDNGSYSRLATSSRAEGMNADDLKGYDKQNAGGGNFLYIKDNEDTVDYTEDYNNNVNTTYNTMLNEVLSPNVKQFYTKKFGADYTKKLKELNTPENVQPKGQKFKEYYLPTQGIRNKEDDSYARGHSLTNEVKGVVMHYTAYENAVVGGGVLPNLIDRNIKEVGAHVVIAEDGTRIKLAEPTDVTFHAGKSYSEKYEVEDVNDFTIGVEFQGNTTTNKSLSIDQINSFIEYIEPIARKHGIPLENFLTHTQVRDAYIKKKGVKGEEAKAIAKHDMDEGQATVIRDLLKQKIY